MKTISIEIYDKLKKLGLKAKAYTLDEILDILPDKIDCYNLELSKINDMSTSKKFYNVGYNLINFALSLVEFESENPAEAAGQLLIWCVENGHIKVDDLSYE